MLYPYLAALIMGSYICYLIDKIKLEDTNIPHYGYLSTIIFTENGNSLLTIFTYAFLLFFKGFIYLAFILLIQRIYQLRVQPASNIESYAIYR